MVVRASNAAASFFGAFARSPTAKSQKVTVQPATVHAGPDGGRWAQLNREGIRVARCTVERLMRDMGCGSAPAPGLQGHHPF